jgi:hypothetical protein
MTLGKLCSPNEKLQEVENIMTTNMIPDNHPDPTWNF